MGVFDYIKVTESDDPADLYQVKCWDRSMETFGLGDEVPEVYGHACYSVQFKEDGRWMNVDECFIRSFTDAPLFAMKFDKYANFWEPKGIITVNRTLTQDEIDAIMAHYEGTKQQDPVTGEYPPVVSIINGPHP